MNTNEHLLTILGEEASEVIKDVSKSLRFGLDDRHKIEGPTNMEKLVNELNDFVAVVDLLVQHAMLPSNWESPAKQLKKKQRVAEFMAYAKKVKALQ